MRPPIPALLGIKDLERLAHRARGLMKAHIVAEWIAEIRSIGRIGCLIAHQFLLDREGQALQILQCIDLDSNAVEFPLVEAIGGKDASKPVSQARQLMCLYLFTAGGFEVGHYRL